MHSPLTQQYNSKNLSQKYTGKNMKWHMLKTIHFSTYNSKLMETTQVPINKGTVQPHNFNK